MFVKAARRIPEGLYVLLAYFLADRHLISETVHWRPVKSISVIGSYRSGKKHSPKIDRLLTVQWTKKHLKTLSWSPN